MSRGRTVVLPTFCHLPDLTLHRQVGDWILEQYPGSKVHVLSLPEVSYDQSVDIMAETDVLISSPGSDIMTGVYLRKVRGERVKMDLGSINSGILTYGLLLP